MHTRTIHETNDAGEQVTRRVVESGAVTYEFAVDLDAVGSEADGHEYLGGDREDVPQEVENHLAEYGAGAGSDLGDMGGGE